MRTVEIPSDIPEDIVVGYARCHQLENWLREMVYLETKAAFGVRYWAECEAALKRIGALGIPPAKSIKGDHRYPHMAIEENDPVWFTSFDTLLKLIFEASMWPLFETYLTAKEILVPKMTEISIIRNRIAHCRGLHKHDIDRLLLILRELDQGIFNFCASYGDAYGFNDEHLKKSPIFKHFLTEEGPWVRSNSRVGLRVKWSARPSANWRDALETGKGLLYHFTYFTHMRENHYFDYREILRVSSGHHEKLAHLILDSEQRRFEVRIPAVVEPGEIIRSAEFLHELCSNCTTYPLKSRALIPEKGDDEDPDAYRFRVFAAELRKFEEIALEWPHYVVPPSHGFAILDPSCTPCTMFGI